MTGRVRLLASGILVAGAIVQAAAPAATSSAAPAASAQSDRNILDGIWLASESSNPSYVQRAWTSTLTIKNGTFAISDFCGVSKSRKGNFTLDANASPKTVDFHLESIDLSAAWDGVVSPECRLAGIYKLDGDRLTVCFATRSRSPRPSDFASKRSDHAVVMSFVRAGNDFKGFPQDITVRVADAAGKPAAGALLFDHMWLSPKPNETAVAWKYRHLATTGADGSARVPYDRLAHAPIGARDIARKLSGFAPISPASSVSGVARITLQPECRVHGTIVSKGFADAGKPIEWTNTYLLYDGRRIGMCARRPGEFEFQAPPGHYTLYAYGEDLKSKEIEITVPAGMADFEISPPVDLAASNLIKLVGHTAPELEGIVGWRGKPVTFADLRGKCVLVEFWGYWCGPCVESMPVLIALQERFGDKGLAIVGVHYDLSGDVTTPEQLDDKIVQIRKKLWKGKDIPFPVALTTEDPGQGRRSAAIQYGITGFPTTLLIDRAGNVVGKFNAQGETTAVAEVEKLLKSGK